MAGTASIEHFVNHLVEIAWDHLPAVRAASDRAIPSSTCCHVQTTASLPSPASASQKKGASSLNFRKNHLQVAGNRRERITDLLRPSLGREGWPMAAIFSDWIAISCCAWILRQAGFSDW